jgi:anionic cell wall polymer biosynthesis LytR-Cps2A-Psr (LCP) family protein
MAKKAAQEVVGFPIEKYATMSFQGFEKAIDALGGITVDVQRAFTDTQYPIAGKEDDPCGKTPDEEQRIAATLSAQLREKEYLCRYESISFVKGNMFMDGATALKFVRSRHAAGDAGDFHRSERQRQVLLAMKKKILSIQFLPKSIGFVQSLAADFQTDLTANDLEFIVGQANIWQAYSVTTILLSDQNVLQMGTSKYGQSILVPKSGSESFAAIQEWITAEMGKY